MKRLLAIVLLAPLAQAQDPPPGIMVVIDVNPTLAFPLAGTQHTVTATVLANGQPFVGTTVNWEITAGPNMGLVGTCTPSAACVADANGEISFTYVGTGGGGADTVRACPENFSFICAEATVDWQCGVPYCFDVFCPCGDAPLAGTDSDVQGCPNETGLGATLFATGSTSVEADDLVLTCTNLPFEKFGIIFMGTSPACIPGFWGGYLAVTGTIVRLGSQNSGMTGTYTQTGLANDPLIEPQSLITPGSTWFFQAWYRSNMICDGQTDGPPGGVSVDANLSNGYCVTFTP